MASPSLYSIVTLLVLLLPFSSQFLISTRTGQKGLQFDSSCATYESLLTEVKSGVYEMAKAAYKSAGQSQSPAYKEFFRLSDRIQVQNVMLNIVRAINGYGAALSISCEEVSHCKGLAGIYMTKTGKIPSDWINVCPLTFRSANGKSAYRAKNDFCNAPNAVNSIASEFMHSLLHMYIIAENKYLNDIYTDLVTVRTIVKGLVHDSSGVVVEPTNNVNNYLYFAQTARYLEVQSDAHLCDPSSGSTQSTDDAYGDEDEEPIRISGDDDDTANAEANGGGSGGERSLQNANDNSTGCLSSSQAPAAKNSTNATSLDIFGDENLNPANFNLTSVPVSNRVAMCSDNGGGDGSGSSSSSATAPVYERPAVLQDVFEGSPYNSTGG